MSAGLMNAAQAAAWLGPDITEDWVRRKANAGEMPYRRVGRRLKFTEQDLLDYLESCRQIANDPLSQSAASRARRRSA